MGFFSEAKHKIEEVVGKIEETVGGAVGNKAMEFSGHAHAEHGESALESDEARMHENPSAPRVPDSGEPVSDEQILAQRKADETIQAARREAENGGDDDRPRHSGGAAPSKA